MAKRELIEPKPGHKRYVRRDEKGHFTDEQDDVGKSLTQVGENMRSPKRPTDRGRVNDLLSSRRGRNK
jgi:hypothetical protein